MVTILLLIVLPLLVAALTVEVGITSWNIRRANRYQRQRDAAKDRADSTKEQVEHITEKFRSLDRYATDVSWLLNFLYNRYDKFKDIDEELNKGVKDLTGETCLEEADKKFQDMKRALKILKVTARASDRLSECMNTIAAQLGLIVREMQEISESGDDEKDDDLDKAPPEESTPSTEPSAEAPAETPPESKDNE